MEWNFAMGNVDVAHRLMITASLPPSSALSSQQTLAFEFFTTLITNSYRVWTLYKHIDKLTERLQRARAGEIQAYDMLHSSKQLLRREPFHVFIESAIDMLVTMANSTPLIHGS